MDPNLPGTTYKDYTFVKMITLAKVTLITKRELFVVVVVCLFCFLFVLFLQK